MTYTAQEIENKPNGWLLTVTDDNNNESTHQVFCKASANTAEDAVAVYEDSLISTGE